MASKLSPNRTVFPFKHLLASYAIITVFARIDAPLFSSPPQIVASPKYSIICNIVAPLNSSLPPIAYVHVGPYAYQYWFYVDARAQGNITLWCWEIFAFMHLDNLLQQINDNRAVGKISSVRVSAGQQGNR